MPSSFRYRFLILLLSVLIIWQIFRLMDPQTPSISQLPNISQTPSISESIIAELEDERYNKHKKDKVKVRVYYEALCPDSKYFFMKHLLPVSEKLSDFITVALVPYGKATTQEVNGKYIFTCQHGKEECYANKIHACSIDYLSNTTLTVKFTECMILDNMNPNEALKRCGHIHRVDIKNISNCANSDQGSELLKKHGDDTNLIKPTFIPTILLNGSKDHQPAILKNFLLEVCKIIDIPLPAPCL